ncbi:unnamed protein product [Prunus armeniaca]|uniref:Cytochrome P450 n=1 Tax=Prunus armeniaca TaxID=36596 RepID=A0A6J5U0C4_PRUAR|nr:unnamed protein product [Prunus armeniaca]
MGFLVIIFTFILLFFFLTLSLFILRIFTGSPSETQTTHLLYDYQTEVAKTQSTYRLLAPHHSELYTTDARNVEHVLKTNFASYSKGAYTQAILSDVFGQGILLWMEKSGSSRGSLQASSSRREFSETLAALCLEEMLPNWLKLFLRFQVPMGFLICNLQAKIDLFSVASSNWFHKSSTLSYAYKIGADLLMRCTLDSIFKVGFGIDLNCLEGSSKEGTAFMKAFDESTALSYFRYVDPFWKLKRFLNLGSEASLKKYIKVIDDFVHQVIRSKRKLLEEQKDVNDKDDILSRFLLESEKDPEEMNDKYLRDIILNFMIAGKDTSANTLSWFFYLLSKNPLIQEKVVQEVRDVVGNQIGEAKIDEFVANITDATLEQMHYLHATLTETLRLFPAVPIDGRYAEVDDILPDGFRVRKGDGVNYMTYAMGRMPYIWGKDADDFRPERWLNNGIFQPESPFKFVAFHAGPRICLGKDFAYRQMKIVATALLCFFRFKLADETKSVTYRTMFTLHIDGSLPMLAVPRTA